MHVVRAETGSNGPITMTCHECPHSFEYTPASGVRVINPGDQQAIHEGVTAPWPGK